MTFKWAVQVTYLVLCLLLVPVECVKRSTRIHVTERVKGRSAVAASVAPSTLSISKRLLAGGAARSLSQMVLYPIDAMRTLAQTRDGRTLADVGVGALLRGCTTTSAFALLMGSIQFAVFGSCRNTVGPLLASAAGAISSCVVSVPQEVIKQRLVTGVYSSFREAVATIYRKEGVLGFYSGWKPTVLRNVPFVVTTFTTMDFVKRRVLEKRPERKELTLLENLSIGTGAALVGVLVTNPADVVKTRMMTQAASTAVPYSSAVNCAFTILKTEGPVAFCAGVKQRSLYVCLLWGMTFGLNGTIQKYLTKG
jgi:solute carrier family 25 (mitochondrial S-adenosylmethionine transporter), member 26